MATNGRRGAALASPRWEGPAEPAEVGRGRVRADWLHPPQRADASLALCLLALVAITILALALRLYGLDRKSVWFDESITALFARQTIPQLINSSFTDTNPPLYYLLMHFWLPLARDDFWFRLPSAFFSALAVAITVLFGRSIGGWGLGLVAGLLTAVAPFAIDMGQEARGYGLLTFLTMLSLWALWEALRGKRQRWWVVFALATTGVIYTHNYALFVAAAEAAYALGYVLWRFGRKQGLQRGGQTQARSPFRERALPASFLIIGVAYVPWIPALLYQAHLATKADFWIQRPDASALLATYTAFTEYTWPPPDWAGYVDGVLLWVVAALAVAGLLSIPWRPGLLLVALGLLVPLAAAIGVSLISTPIYIVRYASFLVPLLWLCVAAGITVLPRPWLRMPITGAVAIALALTLPALYAGPSLQRADLRQAATLVRQTARPGDLMVHTSFFTTYPFEYYNRDQIDQIEVEDPRTIARVVSGHARFWYLVNFDHLNPDAGALTDERAHEYLRPWSILEEHSGLGFHLYLAQPPSLVPSPVGDGALGPPN